MNRNLNVPYIQNLFQHAENIFKLGFDERGECTALAYSERLYHRTAYIQREMEALGMDVRYDAGGNLYGLLKGEKTKKIMVASHLDSVVNAGRYDGVLGIILPLELVRWIKDNGLQPKYSLEILVCMGEESPGITATFGSKLITNHYSIDDLAIMPLAYDRSTNVVEAINNYFNAFDGQQNFAFGAAELANIQLVKDDYLAALEIHIEQFFLLKHLAEKDHDKPYLGVMRGVGGHIRQNVFLEKEAAALVTKEVYDTNIRLHFKGKASHSGATPMGNTYRDDALVKAATFIMRLSMSAWIKEHDVEFTNFEILHPALTSVPREVEVAFNLAGANLKEFKDFVKLYASGVEVQTVSHKALAIDGALAVTMAKLVDRLNEEANNAFPEDEVRATITRLRFDDAHNAQCFCDVRGATMKGMEKITAALEQIKLPPKTAFDVEMVSRKAPAIFDEKMTKEIEEVLGNHFDGRVMKGSISVPGQDIGVLSSYGVPSSLLFIESGTGHHPNEYVREEAMEQAFEALQTLFKYWNNIKN